MAHDIAPAFEPATALAPDSGVMREFLELVFFDAPHGQIEIAFNDYTGDIRKALLFDSSDLAGAAAYAVELNARPGTNVYYGAGIRRPDAPSKRALKCNVLGSRILWADIDSGADRAVKRWQPCPPNVVVTTGTKPERRLQGIWLLDRLITNQSELEARLRDLQQALGGDAAVVDAARVLRLPGSVAWPTPKKLNRVPELVTFEILE